MTNDEGMTKLEFLIRKIRVIRGSYSFIRVHSRSFVVKD